MKRFLLALIPTLLTMGCPGPDKNLFQEYAALNQETAKEVAQAKDWDAFLEIMGKYEEKKGGVFKKIASIPKEKLKDLREFEKPAMQSQEDLEKAILDFHERAGAGKDHPKVLMETSLGTVKIELFEKAAPGTVKNFLRYVDEKQYDGTIFHRVIPDFMIQGGGFQPGLTKEKTTREPIKNESFNYLANNRGTLAMARTGDPHSATAQFFINVTDNKFLNKMHAQDGFGYAVFGRVFEGMEVVDKIRNVRTANRGGHENVPIQDVIIESIRRLP